MFTLKDVEKTISNYSGRGILITSPSKTLKISIFYQNLQYNRWFTSRIFRKYFFLISTEGKLLFQTRFLKCPSTRLTQYHSRFYFTGLISVKSVLCWIQYTAWCYVLSRCAQGYIFWKEWKYITYNMFQCISLHRI